MEMLAHVCLKPDEEKVVKAFAYVAFLDVIGMPKREQPSPFKIEVGEHELNQISEYLGGKNRG